MPLNKETKPILMEFYSGEEWKEMRETKSIDL